MRVKLNRRNSSTNSRINHMGMIFVFIDVHNMSLIDLLLPLLSRRSPKAPSSRRTELTGPYSAPQVNRTHSFTGFQCLSLSSDLLHKPRSSNHLLDSPLCRGGLRDSAQEPLLEKTYLKTVPFFTPFPMRFLARWRLFFCWVSHRQRRRLLTWASILRS